MQFENIRNDQKCSSERHSDDLSEIFNSLNISKVQSFTDTEIQQELDNANITKSEAIAYAISLIKTSDSNKLTQGARILRRLLSGSDNIPIKEVISSNIVPTLIQALVISNEEFALEVL